MKPLRLTLQAFGSYAGTLEIDVARMGRHGVFAITGPTGAGKSTIFDAVVYALYGDLPGFRVDGNIRSHYAEPTTETRVELEFEVHGEVWRIARVPRQTTPRLRGSGAPVTRDPSVVLARAGEPSGGLTRKAQVDARIVELVGLTKEQFEQVVLIPQGRFEEVLKAGTRQRAALLAQLFPVDVYARVTDSLKEIADERRRTFEQAERDHEAVLAGMGRELAELAGHLPVGIAPGNLGDVGAADRVDPSLLPDLLAAVVRVRAELGELVADAAREADAARRARDEAGAAAERWDRWRTDLAAAERFADEEREDAGEAEALARARDVATLSGAIAGWRRAVDTVTQCTTRKAALLDQVERTWVDVYDRDELAGEASARRLAEQSDAAARDLARAAARAEQLDEEAAALARDQEGLARRREELAAADRALAARATAIEADRARLDELAALAGGLGRARSERDARQVEADRARARAVAVSALAGAATAEVAASARAEDARVATESVRDAWRRGLASRLAVHLVDGEPCPTCGATEHPAPAAAVEGAPDDDALERSEAKLERARNALTEASARRSGAEATVRTLGEGADLAVTEGALAEATERVERLEAAEAARGELADDLETRIEALEGDRQASRQAAAEVDGEAHRLDERASRLERDRQVFVAEHGTLTSPAGEAAVRSALATAVRALADVLGQLEMAEGSRDQSLEALAPTMAELGVEDPAGLAAMAVPADELDRRHRALDERRDRRTEVRRRVAEYEAGGVPAGRPDPEPLRVALEAADDRRDDLTRRSGAVEGGADRLLRAPDQLQAALVAIDEARSAFEEARTVHLLCAGQGGAGVEERLSLQNWVLAAYLRQVLSQANVRLATMTAGRYALRLGEGAADGRRQSGLDLAVFDVNTGQVRPATTLSGGETFMAALSLALGLADVVSGGANREIGALFVDEGFGSLDVQSLDGVVEVLRSLEDGGRMVGVISHVAELNQALPNGITVTTSNNGSQAILTYPPE